MRPLPHGVMPAGGRGTALRRLRGAALAGLLAAGAACSTGSPSPPAPSAQATLAGIVIPRTQVADLATPAAGPASPAFAANAAATASRTPGAAAAAAPTPAFARANTAAGAATAPVAASAAIPSVSSATAQRPPPTAPPATMQAVTQLTLEQKVGQMMMVGFTGTSPSGPIAGLVQQLHIGNAVLLGENVDTPAQLQALDAGLQALARQANDGIGMLISVDEEGGTVQRLAPPQFTGLPSARAMASGYAPAGVMQLGQGAGAELRRNGINMDLAPVMDVNDNPANPVIGIRAFGVEPNTVMTYGLAFLAGLHQGGVAGVAKHFPGHGNTSEDSHLTLPYVMKTDAQLRRTELQPFAAAVGAGVDAVMVAHVVYTAWDPNEPASLSPTIISGILRTELGFQGVVMTDDLNMDAITEHWGPGEAAVQAVLAGVDILLIGGPVQTQVTMYNAVLTAVRNGRIPESRIDQSVARIRSLKQKLGVPLGAN